MSTEDLLFERGADRIEHPGGSLLAHLRRTAAQLQRWGAPDELAAAGLCHAAYGTQGFAGALFDLSQREQLRAAIGDAAEGIVYAYCALDREHGLCGPELRDRFSGEYWIPSAHMRRALADLSVANELDVLQDADQREALQAFLPFLSRTAAWQLTAAEDTWLQSDPELAFRLLGTRGAKVLLWHGGASPELTWARQHALASELRLCIPWRRGFSPSAECARQDWEQDTRDLLRLLAGPTHVVAHSYGGVSALLAACSAPERFASLTLIEAPLSFIAPDDPAVEQLTLLSRAFAAGDRAAREAFLRLADLPLAHPETSRVERRARDLRLPSEAAPDLAPLMAADVPIAIVSGAHGPAIETICDALAAALRAERWVIPGKGHSVQRAADFNHTWTRWIGSLSG